VELGLAKRVKAVDRQPVHFETEDDKEYKYEGKARGKV